MAIRPIHYSMLSLGVTAIGVVVAIYYYRQQQAASAAGAGAPSPLFQSAAIPSYAGGGGASPSLTGTDATPATAASTPGPVTTSGLSPGELANISNQQIQDTYASGLATTAANAGTAFTALTGGLLSQMLAQLPSLTPGNQNVADIQISSPTQNLRLQAIYGQDVGPYYQPPAGPTPLTYSSPQGTQVSTQPAAAAPQFIPQPVQSAPYISPPYMLANNFAGSGAGGSGGE